MRLGCRHHRVGIDRLIRLQWLESATRLLIAGNDPQTIKTVLEEMLAANFPGSLQERRSSLGKTITVLVKTWVRVPEELQMLRDRALNFLRERPELPHLPLHWGMIMAVYPFWGAVASQTGRLLKLQADVTAAQIRRRLLESYGDRTTVSRRVRYVLRAFIDWGVIKETNEKGVYGKGASLAIHDPMLIGWLVEAALWARPNGSAALTDIINSTSIFPFYLKPLSGENLITVSPHLEILRQGLDSHLITLRKT